MTYDAYSDPILQALIAEAQADPDVIGLVLTGSRAISGVTHELDYDLMFVVTDVAMQRYEDTQQTPQRGTAIQPPISTADIWHESPRSLQLDKVVSWMLPAYAESQVIYDRTGEIAGLIDVLRRPSVERAQADAAAWYDGYLNALYRSLKCWRRGNELGARMEATHAADFLMHTLFALERRWRPYSSRLIYHMDELSGQGWQSGELAAMLLDVIGTGNHQRQQQLGRRIRALMGERGFGHVYDSWEGKIDECLGWEFGGETQDVASIAEP